MTVDTLQPTQAPGRIGQATAVEQSRAVAEVAAAVQVAQACPRDVRSAVAEMRRACQQPRLAERAFFRYNRGDGMVTGPSIYLARELARCWGNFQAGVGELRRDDEHGQSEMQAWAWDVQTNSRTSTTFIVPHARDLTGGKRRDLIALRDIYENNANNAARRLREMILGLLPQWFVEEAKDLCTATLQAGGGKPLDQRVREAVEVFAGVGVSRERLERRIGHPSSSWTPQDLATLSVIFRSLQRGEIRVEDEFAAERTTVEDVAPAQQAAAPEKAPAEPAQADASAVQDQGAPITRAMWAKVNARLNEIGVNGEGQTSARGIVIRRILDAPQLDMKALTLGQAQHVLDNLAGVGGVELVATVLAEAGADAHLIPAVAQEPEQADPPGDGVEGTASDIVVPDDPAAGYDPTTDADWPTDEGDQA